MTARRPIETPVGVMGAEVRDGAVERVLFPSMCAGMFLPAAGSEADERVLDWLEEEIEQYFSGTLRSFTVPLAWHTPGGFAGETLHAIARIPFGETRSYGELAAELGRPRAARAVGNACGRNEVALVVPCHRVVAANGLGGYAGNEWMKRALLAFETGDANPWRFVPA